MKTLILLTIVQLISQISFGYVLPFDTVVDKTVANSGNQIFSVEQDVVFKIAGEDFVVRESWLIEGDKNLRLTAVGLGSLKELVRFNAIYNTKTRTVVQAKNRVSEVLGTDFFERYLSIRSDDSFKKLLADLFIPNSIRLSRVGGVPAFAIGEPSQPDSLKPQMWIDQDVFHIRKIRLPSGAEAHFDDYAVYGNIHYPKTKRVDWPGHSATIKVRQVSTKTKSSLSSFYPQNLDQSSELNLTSKGEAGLTIQEFYKRFR